MIEILKRLDEFRERRHTLNVKEAAFLSLWELRTTDSTEGTEAFLQEYVPTAGENKEWWCDSLWLWILGEYVTATSRTELLNRYKEHIHTALSGIGMDWAKPQEHLLISREKGIYLSNLGVMYGAVQSINNTLRDENAQKLLKELREYVFGKMLYKGMVVSRLGSSDIEGDIGLCAIPFGLLNAGDQVLVGAVQIAEEKLVAQGGVRFQEDDTYYGGCTRPDLTILLAWYYSEKGDITRAKWLLEQAEKSWAAAGAFLQADLASAKIPEYTAHDIQQFGPPRESEISYILYGLALANIFEKESGSSSAANNIQILHRPTGSTSPYLVEWFERVPRYPEHHESVIVRMKTEPFRKTQNAHVEFSVNGGDLKCAAMTHRMSKDGERYWQADLGGFGYGTHVRYRFVVTDSEEEVDSDWFEFCVRTWVPLTSLKGVQKTEQSTDLIFDPLEGTTRCPKLSLRKQNDRAVKWTFAVEDYIGGHSSAPDEELTLPIGDYQVRINTSKLHFTVTSDNEQILRSYDQHSEGAFEVLTDGTGEIFKIRMKLLMPLDERMYGTGERFTEMEFRGRDVDHYVFNQYKDQGLKTYMPVPIVFSSRGYGLYLDTFLYSVFRFGTRLSDLFEVEMDINERNCSFYLFLGSFTEVINEYTNVTGKPKLPPKWAFGPWMSSNNWDSQAETYKQLEMTLKHRIPATVLVLEQWSDEATFYIFNDAQYTPKHGMEHHSYEEFNFPEWGRWPNPKQMVKDLHRHGVKVLLWQIPVIKFMEGISHAQKDEDEKAALEAGLCVQKVDDQAYRIPSFEWFKGSLVPDFSNPDCREWWFNKRRYLIEEIGVDGFKTDGGECIYGDDLTFHDGRTGLEMRNEYPNEYIAAYHQFANSIGEQQRITFSRAGYSGAQNYPMHWAGDEKSTFEAFRNSIVAGLTSGMSGIPFWGWDLAGFHGDIPTAELFIRSAQMAAFCPIMQYHAETKGEFNQDRTPWNIAERTQSPWVIDLYKKFADLRMNLIPYIYDQAVKTSRTGIPLMRAMVVEYPNDPSCMDLAGQYMFGDSLLVAPITEENRTTKNVYFPKGRWISLFGSEEITGSCLQNVKAEIGDIPVYIKEDSIVALNLPKGYQMTGEVGNQVDAYAELTFYIYLKSRIQYRFEDDLGNVVHINALVHDDRVIVELSNRIEMPITLVFLNVSDVRTVKNASHELAPVTSVDELDLNHYCLEKSNLYMKAASKSETFYIEKNK